MEITSFGFSQIFLLFLCYSFIGWVAEELWVSILYKKIENRGMLYGPICPIYGLGSLLIIILISPWKNSLLGLFLSSFIICSVLEYFSSWILEKLFHTKWWDYSKKKFNINGRVCLLNSLAFGFGGIILLRLMHPIFENILLNKKYESFINVIFPILLILFLVDFSITIYNLIDFTQSLKRIKNFTEELKASFEKEKWFQKKNFKSMLESVKNAEKKKFLKVSSHVLKRIEKYLGPQKNLERWCKKFPTINSKEFKFILEHVKKSLSIRKSQNKENNDSTSFKNIY